METRFSTYASYWIKQSIRRAVMNNGKPIRLPAYMVSLLAKWKRATAVLADRLGRPPTPEEIGKALRLSKKKLGIVTKAIQVNNLTPHTDGSQDDGYALDDMLTDERSKAPDDLLIEADDLEQVMHRLDELDDREATVIRMRFGLDPYVRHDPARGRREPRPDPRAGPPDREPGALEADLLARPYRGPDRQLNDRPAAPRRRTTPPRRPRRDARCVAAWPPRFRYFNQLASSLNDSGSSSLSEHGRPVDSR